MILPLFSRRPQTDTIATLYGMIVAQARLGCFYSAYGVSDTVNGRFDMIVLHLALFLRRLRAESEQIRALGQGVFDFFCNDMENNLREMGIGDLAIPKRMRAVGDAFYGRAEAYDVALASGEEQPLIAAIERNLFAGEAAKPDAARRFAAYVRAAAAELAAQDAGEIARGKLGFPDPAKVAATAFA